MKWLKMIFITLVFVSFIGLCFSQPELEKTNSSPIKSLQPLSDPDGAWFLQEDFSDEFENETLDLTKWDNRVFDWGDWSWNPENVFIENNTLGIRMAYEEHVRKDRNVRKDRKYFYKSGIIRSRALPIKYGYFEARIKASDRYPGVCPAFWASNKDQTQWTEIDFVELTQSSETNKKIYFNTHVFKHDKLEAGKKLHEGRFWYAPWVPYEDFHTYGCEWDKDEIKWFVDGQMVASRKNDFWHQPLNITLSMGLRAPLRKTPSQTGFPAIAHVDYVRVWKKCPNYHAVSLR
jgi:beta-glucanase (GH16 family)